MTLALDGPNLLVAFAALLGGFAAGLSGFAFGLVALALWLQVLAPKIAGPLVILSSAVVQTFSAFHLRETVRFDLLWPFIVGGVIGVPFGIWLLNYTDPQLFRRGVGVFLILYSAYALLAPPLRPIRAGGRVADGSAGFVGGVMGGMAGLFGPAPIVWCELRGWGKDLARGVFQPFNLSMQVIAALALFVTGLVTRELGSYLLLCLPTMLLGAWLGVRLYARIDARHFRNVVLGLLLVSGVTLEF